MNTVDAHILSPRLRSACSILIIVHLGLFIATLSTAAVDWIVRDRLIDITTPYTAAIHLHLGGRPIADASYTTADWLHVLQYRLPGQEQWQSCDLGIGKGVGGPRRYQRHLITIAEAAEREDTATAAMLAEPIVAELISEISSQTADRPASNDAALSDQGVAVEESRPFQFFQLRVLARVVEQQEDGFEEVVRWQAGVVSKPNLLKPSKSGWAVVYLEEPRLNAKAALVTEQVRPISMNAN